MSDLVHLIYASAATRPFTTAELSALLQKARASNDRLQVTGMLLYSNGSFFQILEGSSEVVDTLFARIAADPRHDRTATIIREAITRRTFGDWTMGFTTLNDRDYIDLVGMNDFFDKASCFTGLSRSRAKKILAAFAEGRWRAKLETPVFANAATAR